MNRIKKRILVPIVGQGSITHIIRTGMLDKLSSFCKPVVALLWQQNDLVEELQAKGYEVICFPAYAVSNEYVSLKAKINMWYLQYKLKTPSVNIQQTYLAQFRKTEASVKFKKRLKDAYYKLKFSFQPLYAEQLIKEENEMMHGEAVFTTYMQWLTELKIEGLFTVTPFLAEVDLIARILKELHLPLIASIHSFDNVTKRGWQSVVFDHYIVWNKYNKAELERIHQVLQTGEAVTIAGAPQFDFHYNDEFCWSRSEWLQRLGLPGDKKIVLYGGGPVSLFPNETQYLKALKEAFDNGKLSSDFVILFRCHPLDRVERWKKYVGESPYIYYDSAPNGKVKLDHTNVSDDDIIRLVSTLKHTDIHINVISTMAVDGSVFDKPQIGPYYDEVYPSGIELFRKMYFQEHYVPIMKTTVVNLAHNKDELINLVNKTMENPAAFTNNCKNCVEEIISYSDGRSTERAVSAIKNFLTNENTARKP